MKWQIILSGKTSTVSLRRREWDLSRRSGRPGGRDRREGGWWSCNWGTGSTFLFVFLFFLFIFLCISFVPSFSSSLRPSSARRSLSLTSSASSRTFSTRWEKKTKCAVWLWKIAMWWNIQRRRCHHPGVCILLLRCGCGGLMANKQRKRVNAASGH